MGFNARRAASGIYDTVLALAEPRASTALLSNAARVFTGPVAQGTADMLSLMTRGLCSDVGGWESTRENYWDNFLTGGEL